MKRYALHDVLVVAAYAVLFVSVLGMALATYGCAPGTDGARQAIAAAERVEAQAIGSLEAFDATYQAQIVAQAHGDTAAGEKALAQYRAKRAVVVKATLDATTLTAFGASLVTLVDLGAKKSSDLTAWLVSLGDALDTLRKALSALGVPLPGGA